MIKKLMLIAAVIVLVFSSMNIAFAENDNTEPVYRTGLLPEDEDFEELKPAKQLPASYQAAALPVSVDLSVSEYFPPINTQGNQGSCASFATTYYAATYTRCKALDINVKDSSNPNDYILSPAFTYPLVNSGKDSGSSTSANMRILCSAGAPSLSSMPYNHTWNVTAHDYTQWATDASVWEEAITYKFKDYEYYNYNGTTFGVEDIKAALNGGDVLVFSTYINSAVMKKTIDNPNSSYDDDYVNQHIISYRNGTDGAHAMTLAGYNDHIWNDINGDGTMQSAELGAFLVVNSWGSWWKNSGKVWLSYDAFKSNSSLRSSTTAFLSWNNIYYLVPYESEYVPDATMEINITAQNRYSMNIDLSVYDQNTSNYVQTRSTPFSGSSSAPSMPFGGVGGSSTGTVVLDLSEDSDYSPSNNYTWHALLLKHYSVKDNYTINSSSASFNSTVLSEHSDNTYPFTVVDGGYITYEYVNNAPYVSPPAYLSFSSSTGNNLGVYGFSEELYPSSSLHIPGFIGHDVTVDTIKYYAFSGNTTLQSIILPGTIKTIEGYAFQNCTNLSSITIPQSVTSINTSAFTGCSGSLTFRVFAGSYAHTYALNRGYNVQIISAGPGDFNQDGYVDLLDFAVVAGYYQQNAPEFDLNSDGIVNLFDMVVLGSYAGN